MEKQEEKKGVNDVAAVENNAAAVGKNKKRSVANTVSTCIGLVVVLVLFFVVAVLAVDKFVKKSAVPSFFGTSTLIVATGSMSGTIEEGDLIVVRKADEYKVGDVVTFLIDGDKIPTTHRIIRISGDKFYTKGDANNAEDPRSVTQDEIVGKVTATVPKIGLFFKWFREDFGWAYFVAMILVIAAGVILLKQFPNKKRG